MSAGPTDFPRHGLWRVIPSPAFTEIFSQSGFDFQILDCEHGAYDYATLLPDILACERHGCAPMIRVSGHDKIEVQRCLDLGARGLVFPQLGSAADFERAGAMMDYAPQGTRGYNPFVRAGGYGVVDGSRPAAAEGRPWFVPIVETLQAAAEIEAIAGLDRIDCIYIGVYDLSAQLGCAGNMDTPALQELIDRVIDACRRAAKPVGMMSLSAEGTARLTERGVHALVHGVDSHRVKQAMTEIARGAEASARAGQGAPTRP